ncbi:MAG: protein kinase [Tyzzerella sp.]|nr:protein kinase [Tyzzerella sp.]
MYKWKTKDIEWILMQLEERKLPFKKYKFSGLGQGMNILGSGGYSRVYGAQSRITSSDKFAIKVIGFNDKHVDSGAFRETVQGQKQVGFLQKNIVKVYDFVELKVWVDDDNNVIKAEKVQNHEKELPKENYLTLRFVVMEKLIPVLSEDLTIGYKIMPQKLADFHEKEILKLAYDIGRALAQAHEFKLLHRDVKLENIFYSPSEGCYKLGDFGIAKITENGIASTVAYTKGYGAPEVISASQMNYDNTADIYSFGMLLYVLMNGLRFPESDKYAANVNSQYNQGYELTKPLHGSEKLFCVVDRMCKFDPDDRYQSVEEVLNSLDVIRIGETIEVKKKNENNALVLGTVFLIAGMVACKLIYFPDMFIGFTQWEYVLLGLLILKAAMRFAKIDPTLFNFIILGVGIYSVFDSGFNWWKLLILLLIVFSKGVLAGAAAVTALVLNIVSIVTIYNNLSLVISGEYKWVAVLLLSLSLVLLYQYAALNSDDYKLKFMLFKRNVYWILVSITYGCCVVYGMALNNKYLQSLDLFKIGMFGLAFCAIWNVAERVWILRKINSKDVNLG